MLITCDSEKVEPGLKGNLIAVAFVMVTPPPPTPEALDLAWAG